MELIELFIEKYKKFEKINIKFFDESIQDQDLVEFFFLILIFRH